MFTFLEHASADTFARYYMKKLSCKRYIEFVKDVGTCSVKIKDKCSTCLILLVYEAVNIKDILGVKFKDLKTMVRVVSNFLISILF